MPSVAELYEDYLRKDQEWRIESLRSLLEYAEFEKDIRQAKAELDNEQLLRDRLDALILYEKAKSDSNDYLSDAIANSHVASASYYGRLNENEKKSSALLDKLDKESDSKV